MGLSDWDPEGLWLALEPLQPGLSVEVLPEIASTNTALLARARAGDTQGCLLVAQRQTAGRGRMGRQWWAEPGQALTFSLGLLLAPAPGVAWGGLSLAVGLALAEALDPAGDHVGLKWPNDLWTRPGPAGVPAGDRKLGGILIETQLPTGADTPAATLATAARWVVIGVGLNIRPAPTAAAAEFRTPPACVQEWHPQASAGTVLHRVAPALLRAVQAWAQHGLAPLQARYAARDVLAGRALQAGALQGTADGLDADGALRLRDASGHVHALHSGEVSVRPC
jgi:BirA family transcriptional regulator, biotin operon repressor / biotin---[acetyl-CoA-carboxylase] ligase